MWKINNRDYLSGGSGIDEHAEAAARLMEAGTSLVEAAVRLMGAGVRLVQISGGADLAGMCRRLVRGPDRIRRFPAEDAPLPAPCADSANRLLSIANGMVACRPRTGGKA